MPCSPQVLMTTQYLIVPLLQRQAVVTSRKELERAKRNAGMATLDSVCDLVECVTLCLVYDSSLC